jgi:hypothetical protein
MTTSGTQRHNKGEVLFFHSHQIPKIASTPQSLTANPSRPTPLRFAVALGR